MWYRVVKAPKGSAVFETVSEQLYSGVVLDKMQAKGSNISSGLVQYEEDGRPAKLAYGPKDLQVHPFCEHCDNAYQLLILPSRQACTCFIYKSMKCAGQSLPLTSSKEASRFICWT